MSKLDLLHPWKGEAWLACNSIRLFAWVIYFSPYFKNEDDSLDLNEGTQSVLTILALYSNTSGSFKLPIFFTEKVAVVNRLGHSTGGYNCRSLIYAFNFSKVLVIQAYELERLEDALGHSAAPRPGNRCGNRLYDNLVRFESACIKKPGHSRVFTDNKPKAVIAAKTTPRRVAD
jgi:hypothetical protein